MNMDTVIKYGNNLFEQIKLLIKLCDLDCSYEPILNELLQKQKDFWTKDWDKHSLQMMLENFNEANSTSERQ